MTATLNRTAWLALPYLPLALGLFGLALVASGCTTGDYDEWRDRR